MSRIPTNSSEIIDRNSPIEFVFNGKSYSGFKGDTITSALLANGVKVLGRSFKYHRPRSILSFANHDMNVIVQNHAEFSIPNVRADVTPLKAGMIISAVNTFGSLENDKGSILSKFSKFLPVGFYYKAFHTKALFPQWEKLFRALTGLGKVDFKTPAIKTPKQYGFCDILIIGGGISGLSAAIEASKSGKKITIVDEGQILGGTANLISENAEKAKTYIKELQALSNVTILTSTYAAGYYADNWIPLIDAEKMTKMRAKTVIFATGGYEQPAVFRNNDVPGVALATGLLRAAKLYSAMPYKKLVFLVANSWGYEAALEAVKLGFEIPAIVDLRAVFETPQAASELVANGIELHRGACIYEVVTSNGNKAVSSVKISSFDGKNAGENLAEISCDGVAMATGFAPALNLMYQAGTKMSFDEIASQFVPETLPKSLFAAGKPNGIYSFEAKIGDGKRAALDAIAFLDGKTRKAKSRVTENYNHPWPIIAHEKGWNFVDYDEDLKLQDFYNAAQEGFDNIELIKRYSTNGMGPSQGKHSNMNGLRILADILGKSPQEVGTTTSRPFYHPVPMGHLAGRAFSPERLTPMHDNHIALGAVFMSAGQWQRPEYYAKSGQSREEAIAAEVMAVHEKVGIIDVGTLGKLEIYGKDAAEFLERVYISKYKDLKTGRARYGVMCDESGVIIDDGVIAKMADDHFYFTTTTSGAATIYRELSRLNILWGLDCGIVNHTGAYAAINLAGPKAREVLAKLTDLDLSAKEFPFMAVKTAKVAGIDARLLRVGFVGEWGIEIHVPHNDGKKLWDSVIEAGLEFGITPFGVEAQRMLRLQKAHIIIGQDTDGLTIPSQAGLSWAVKMDKPFFIGKRSLQIQAQKTGAQVIAGFEITNNPNAEPPKECHLIIDNGDIAGRITSVGKSPILGKTIGLCYIKPDLSKAGTNIQIRLTNGSFASAKIVPTPFYDAENLRQKEASND